MEPLVSDILYLGLMILTGITLGALAHRLGLPRVAAYVLAGVLFSPDLLGLLHSQESLWGETLTTLSLAVIAFMIGTKLETGHLENNKGPVLLGAGGGTLVPVILVTAALSVYLPFRESDAALPLALVLGAIAATTAPAATMAVIEEYQAKGTFTNVLLGIVTVDDAFGVLLFAGVMGFLGGTGTNAGLLAAGLEVVGSLVTGLILGLLLGWAGNRVPSEQHRLPLILGFLFTGTGLCQLLHFSPLLMAIALGLVSTRVVATYRELWVTPIRHMEEFVFVVLFTLAGAHFRVGVFFGALDLILIYALFRGVGKILGLQLGLGIAGNGKGESRWMGLAMIPQAGVAIGLAFSATLLPSVAPHRELLFNVVLGSVIINELTGPLLAKEALRRAGDLKPA